MSGFTKFCIYCNKEIRLSNDTGRWLPYNLDNTAHECKGKQKFGIPEVVTVTTNKPQTQPQTQNKSSSTLTLEELDARLKKVERIVLGTN